MPVIEPEDQSIKCLKGIHLWHAGLSSCSQRVRICLAEKGQDFESHLINLLLGENASPDYQRIHPKGVVPALVIDGMLIIESIDIITVIDQHFKPHSLCPSNSAARADMLKMMKIADAAQPNLKLLTFAFLFSAAPPPPPDVAAHFQKHHRSESLKNFHRAAQNGFSRPQIEAAVNACHEDFIALEKALADGRTYLAGDTFSLADVSWMPNVHRFALFDWPFAKYRLLSQWFERVQARESYKTALLAWEPEEMLSAARHKIAERVAARDGVATYGALNHSFEEAGQ